MLSFSGGGVRIGGVMVVDADDEILKAAEFAKTVDRVLLCVDLNANFE